MRFIIESLCDTRISDLGTYCSNTSQCCDPFATCDFENENRTEKICQCYDAYEDNDGICEGNLIDDAIDFHIHVYMSVKVLLNAYFVQVSNIAKLLHAMLSYKQTK